jgi:hypothetical protein
LCLSFLNSLKQSQSVYIYIYCCLERDIVTAMLSVLLHKTFTVQILYKLYRLQLNCTYSNYTEAAATCSAAQQHSTFTVQILYKLYSLQLDCTYSNYTEAATTCSAEQQHSTFTLQILYKLYSLQLNYTYCNYAEAAATCSAAQEHSTFTVLYKYSTVCNGTVLTVITQELPPHVQLHNRRESVEMMSSEVDCRLLFDIAFIYVESHWEIRYFRFTLLAASVA